MRVFLRTVAGGADRDGIQHGRCAGILGGGGRPFRPVNFWGGVLRGRGRCRLCAAHAQRVAARVDEFEARALQRLRDRLGGAQVAVDRRRLHRLHEFRIVAERDAACGRDRQQRAVQRLGAQMKRVRGIALRHGRGNVQEEGGGEKVQRVSRYRGQGSGRWFFHGVPEIVLSSCECIVCRRRARPRCSRLMQGGPHHAMQVNDVLVQRTRESVSGRAFFSVMLRRTRYWRRPDTSACGSSYSSDKRCFGEPGAEP